MSRILLVDDHALVRQGIRRILQEFLPAPVEIDEAATGQEAINRIRAGCHDVVLLDISLSDRNGLDVLQQVNHFCPETSVVILTMHAENEYAVRALRAGAKGYLTKMTAPAELVLAVETVLDGRRYISPAVADILVQEITQDRSDAPLHHFLSDRELQVACMLSQGRTPTQIAETLCISVKTVSTYRTRIFQKLQLGSNAALVNYCRDNNLTL